MISGSNSGQGSSSTSIGVNSITNTGSGSTGGSLNNGKNPASRPTVVTTYRPSHTVTF